MPVSFYPHYFQNKDTHCNEASMLPSSETPSLFSKPCVHDKRLTCLEYCRKSARTDRCFFSGPDMTQIGSLDLKQASHPVGTCPLRYPMKQKGR